MTIAEGGGKRALTQKFRDVYLPTLKANFVLWPAVQILNFRVIPIQFQIVSSIALSSVISHTNTRPALCLVRWNWVDRIPLAHKLGGRGLNTVAPANDTFTIPCYTLLLRFVS